MSSAYEQDRSRLFDKIQTVGKKKWKQLRRDMKFYETNFGFKETFKVICDGTFVHHCLTQRLGDLETSLSTFLKASAKPLVTSCIIAELKKIAEAADAYSESAIAAQGLDLIKCEHEPSLLAADCLANLVGSGNEEHYFVATQDTALRERLRQVPGGALIYANYAPFNLEYPSITQYRYAKMGELELQTPTEHDKQSRAGMLSTKGGKEDAVKSRNPLGVADRPVFKKRCAKAQERKKNRHLRKKSSQNEGPEKSS